MENIRNLLKQAELILLPYMDQAHRDTWLTEAIQWRDKALYHDIDLSGANKPFTTRCVQLLWEYGTLDGDLALNHLLFTLESHMGAEKRLLIADLSRKLKGAYLSTYEVEQAQQLSQLANENNISETEAKPLVGELIQESTRIQTHQAELPPDIQNTLQDILDQLQDINQSAAAKLKVTLPIIPLLAAYELELDTESLLNNTWDKVKALFRKTVDENP